MINIIKSQDNNMAEQTSNSPQETTVKDNEQKQRQPKKMVTSTVKDVISKGRTMTGKKPDQIDINPVKENSDLFKHVSDVYDKFVEDVDRTDTYKREWGTDSLTNMYKNDTPGQKVNKNFIKIFGKGKEAVARSEYDRKEIDTVPRIPDDRKEDTRPFRHQSIVKRRKDVDEGYGKGYKSPWDKIEKAKPGIGKRIDSAVADLKQSQKDYQAILDKEKKEKETKTESVNASVSGGMRGLGHTTGSGDGESSNYVGQNIADADTKNNLLKQQLKAHLSLHVVGKADKKVAKEEVENTKINEDLRDWFKDKWVRMDTKGNIKGDCAREPGEGKPKCLPVAKARAMDKEDRAAAARRKRREDPVADRPGKGGAPINVRTEAANPAQQAAIAIALIKAGKKKGKVPAKEEFEFIEEKNKPTNPTLWSRAKALARSKFDVYPSAYANGWAAKWYKSKGGGWRSE